MHAFFSSQNIVRVEWRVDWHSRRTMQLLRFIWLSVAKEERCHKALQANELLLLDDSVSPLPSLEWTGTELLPGLKKLTLEFGAPLNFVRYTTAYVCLMDIAPHG